MPKQNVPALRLEGFSGEWESHTLGNISNMYQPHTISSVDLLDAGIPVFGANGFIGFYHKANHFADEVTISVRGEKTGTPNLVEGPSWITGNSMVVSVDSGKVDKFYLYAALCSRPLKKFVTGGAQPQLTRGTLKHVFISLPPTLEEQQAIGAIFTNLDAAINQHTLKHKALQQSKTALMQRMFPQEGQTVPELRLEGFSGEWKTTSIGAVSALHNGRDYKHLGEGCIPVYGTGGYMASVDQALSHDKDAVGIGRKGTINKPYILRAPFWTVDTLFYVVPNQDTDLAFFYASVLQVDWMAKNTATGLPSLTSQAINSADISVPPTLEEQQAIGAIFTKLDRLIAAEAQYIESFKQAKTALLQRMFI